MRLHVNKRTALLATLTGLLVPRLSMALLNADALDSACLQRLDIVKLVVGFLGLPIIIVFLAGIVLCIRNRKTNRRRYKMGIFFIVVSTTIFAIVLGLSYLGSEGIAGEDFWESFCLKE